MGITIKAINPDVKSMKLNIPFDGIIEIDANGITTVSDKAAEALVKGTNDWKYLDEKVTTTKEEKVISNAEKSEDEIIVAGIKQMSIDDMIKMAQEAGYPEKEWSRFSKKEKLMAAYLIKKYNEVKLEEDNNAD